MDNQVPPPQQPSAPSPPRQTPAEHAAAAFAPQDIPVTPVLVRGPLIATPLDPPSSPAPAPSPAPPSSSSDSNSSPLPVNAEQAPPAGNALPPPSAPAEAKQPPGAGQVEAVSVRIELGEQEQKDAEEWQRERIERKLRGEYERAQRGLAEIINENLDQPMRLNAIRILGATHTRPSFLSRIFAPHLTSLPPPSFLSSSFPPTSPTAATDPISAYTLRSVLKTSQEIVANLEKFDIFRTLSASIEKPLSVLAHPEEVDLVLRVTEAPRYFLRTATDVGDGEGSATATAKIRNAFGGGETVEGNMSFGTRTKNAFQVRLDTPLFSSPTTRFDLTAFQAQRDLNFYASCMEGTKGLMARVRGLSPYGVHEVAYEAVLRQVGEIAPGASMSIRNSAGPSTKSALSHTFTHDTRDDPFLSTRGAFVKLRQEYAGLGGDAAFVKAEGEGSLSRPLLPSAAANGGAWKGWSYSLSGRAGVLFPLFSPSSPSPSSAASKTAGPRTSLFSDRFHLGGPTSVRSFRPNSMGPRDSADYVGGDAFYALGASLLAPFPFIKKEKRGSWWETNLRSHLWVNAGKLIPTGSPCCSLLTLPPSLTAGVGVMYRHSLVRIEANVGVPLVQHRGEGGVKGLQFGLGLSFL
ncbi:hypothetical protein JCM6882_006257 [Rhodosporidiobolus microsporus]